MALHLRTWFWKVSFKMLACILKRNLDSTTLEREDLDDYQRKRFYEPQEINKSSSLLLLDSIIIIQSWSKRRLLIRIFERKEGENLYIYFFACPWTPYFISLFIWGSLSTVEHPQKTTSKGLIRGFGVSSKTQKFINLLVNVRQNQFFKSLSYLLNEVNSFELRRWPMWENGQMSLLSNTEQQCRHWLKCRPTSCLVEMSSSI